MKSTTTMIRTWCAAAIATTWIASAQAALPVANAGPDLAIADYDGNNSVTARLNASASTDSDGDITSYEWTWDGGSTTGQISEGVFPATNSPVTVTLTVTDALGGSSTDTLVVAAHERPYSMTSPSRPIGGERMRQLRRKLSS
jgi:PKD repeat protein